MEEQKKPERPEAPKTAELEGKTKPAEKVADKPAEKPTEQPTEQAKKASPVNAGRVDQKGKVEFQEKPTGRPGCPSCGNEAIGMAGGMRHCSQCGHRWEP